ncbi:hypothetical protein QM806_39910 [Rhodococcus sp. IEGM 1351]|uniref:hypothetical protein n=1 Tax=Rhodococcus sp. IEGM 1351 TaxID=3047089 RepID=UPI0024B7A67B|nr:hypothetical protein [Rhodococcus sp. IEGM 1351]MDI9941512.1 hypothetical protein [Rhodococcus sp. IEGM 1351]
MSPERDRVSGLPSPQRTGWSGRWASGVGPLLDPATGSRSRDSATSDDLDALSSLSQSLFEAVTSGSWAALLGAPLLADHDEDTIDLEEREKLLIERLPSIAHITERFITRLGERSELLPVSRVKRPARRSLERLAAHTEDWAGRSLAGPVPRRALAVTRVEDANLYENRMVAELVHPILSSALLARIRKLRRLLSDLSDLNQAQHVGTYHRTQRLYSFWGDDALKAAASHLRAAKTLESLDKLAAWVQSLRGSTLSRLLLGKVTGHRSLRRTNVINNDRHYRAAGDVWATYERPEIASETPDARRDRLARRHTAFDHYVLGLVVRALGGLGFTSRSGSLPMLGEGVELEGIWGEANLIRGTDGVLTIGCHDSTIRIVPLLDVVGPQDDHVAIGQRWRDLQAAADRPTIVVFLASSTDVRSNPDRMVAGAMASAKDDSLGRGYLLTGVPVSPLETTSLERVARGVALAVRVPPLLAYPPPLTLGDQPMPLRLVDHLESSGIDEPKLSPLFHRTGNTLKLRRPLVTSEQTRLMAVVRNLAVAARGTGWQRDFGDHISQVINSIDLATTFLLPLLSCPVCFAASEARRLHRADDVFMIECQSCGARWGHERCGSCQARIPMIEPEQQLLNPEIKGPGWVERIFGQDALSSPCWARTSANRYICPECRVCPLAIDATGAACTRCH